MDREEMEAIGMALASRVRSDELPPDDAYHWARIVAHEARQLPQDEPEPMFTNRLPLTLLLLALAVPAYAQTPILPGQLISFEIDPGVRQESPTSPNTVPRPEANLVFEYRIDGTATPVAAVKHAPCTLVTPTGVMLTCRLRPPALSPGPHTIEVRALVVPAEQGIPNSAYTAPLAVTTVIVTGPSVPSNLRVTNPLP